MKFVKKKNFKMKFEKKKNQNEIRKKKTVFKFLRLIK